MLISFFQFLEKSHAQDNANTINVVLYNIYPWGFHDKDRVTGAIHDVCKTIVENAGYTFNQTGLYPFARALKMLEHGYADFSVFNKNESLELVHPLVNVLSTNTIVVSDKQSKFFSLKDLQGQDIGVIRGAKYLQAFHDDPKITKVPVKTYDQAMRMLMAGRYAGFIGTEPGILPVMKKLKISVNDYHILVVDVKEAWLMYSKLRLEQDMKNGKIDALLQSVNALKRKNVFDTIVKQYL